MEARRGVGQDGAGSGCVVDCVDHGDNGEGGESSGGLDRAPGVFADLPRYCAGCVVPAGVLGLSGMEIGVWIVVDDKCCGC